MITNKPRNAPSRTAHNANIKLSSGIQTQKELHDDSYKQVLRFINGHLGARMAVLQRYMHNRVSDKLTNFVTQTAGRPSGVLGGGVVAGIGSVAAWYLASRYGFHYPPMSLTFFYVVGFMFGLFIEVCIKLMRHYR